jgi:hypothetical protein
MRSALIVTLAVAALGAGGMALALAIRDESEGVGTVPSRVVYVPQLGVSPEVRPRYVAPAATNQGFVIKRWRSYGGERAVADAEYSARGCKPSCATGTWTISRNVLVLSRIGACEGLPAYLTATVRKSDDPEMEGTSVDLARFCRDRRSN